MRQKTICVLLAMLSVSPAALAAANCGHSSSWQCQHQGTGSATQTPSGTTGITVVQPQQGTTTTPLGSIHPDVHNVALIPLGPSQKTPSPTGVVAPPSHLPPQRTPPLVPPLPNKQITPQTLAVVVPPTVLPTQKVPPLMPQKSAQQTPTPKPIAVPPQVLPPQQVPVLVPPQPGQQTPTPQAIAMPPQILPPQQVPILVPPQPGQQTPTPQAIAMPPQVLPPQQVPILVPPQPGQQTSTPQLITVPPVAQQLLALPMLAPSKPGTQQPGSSIRPTTHFPPTQEMAPDGHQHALMVHYANTPKPVTSGRHDHPAPYSLEFIEPGLQNRKVKVYRSQDARETVYKDTIPLDKGGFQLIVVGTRNPEYTH